MTTYHVVGLEKSSSGEMNFWIDNIAQGVLVSPDADQKAKFDNVNFKVLPTGLQLKGNNTDTTPPAGFIGERVNSFVNSGSAVGISNNTNTNLTSIELSAGIWDVSAIGVLNGALTGTSFSVAISTTSETMGNEGDNQVTTSALPISGVDSSLQIPSYRLELSETTTVYLVARATFLLGSASGYGRISAVRAA